MLDVKKKKEKLQVSTCTFCVLGGKTLRLYTYYSKMAC
jgi:hypothetical protein